MRNEDIFKVCFSQLRGLSQLVGLAYEYIFVFPVGLIVSCKLGNSLSGLEMPQKLIPNHRT